MSRPFISPRSPLLPRLPQGTDEAGQEQVSALLLGTEPVESPECLDWKGPLGRQAAPVMQDPNEDERAPRWVLHVLLPLLDRPRPSEKHVLRRIDECPSDGLCIRPSHALWELPGMGRLSKSLEEVQDAALRFVGAAKTRPTQSKVIQAMGEHPDVARNILHDLCRDGLLDLQVLGTSYRFSLTDAGRERLAESA